MPYSVKSKFIIFHIIIVIHIFIVFLLLRIHVFQLRVIGIKFWIEKLTIGLHESIILA